MADDSAIVDITPSDVGDDQTAESFDVYVDDDDVAELPKPCGSPLEPETTLCPAVWNCVNGCDQAQEPADCVSDCQSQLSAGAMAPYEALTECVEAACPTADNATTRQECAETECAELLATCMNPCGLEPA